MYGNGYDFSVDYSTISNDEILRIHKYLMKRMVKEWCSIV